MIPSKQKIFLIRHGETEWTLSDRHTGLTDIPLTSHGKEQALKLKEKLSSTHFRKVLVSPLQRAKLTCQLAGFLGVAEIDEDLVEWNYGDYEGKKTADILKKDPAWDIFTKGAPGGESIADVDRRARRVIKKIRETAGDLALFSSGHILRAIAACWLGMTAAEGKYFQLSTASISTLGYEHENPVILTWNQTS